MAGIRAKGLSSATLSYKPSTARHEPAVNLPTARLGHACRYNRQPNPDRGPTNPTVIPDPSNNHFDLAIQFSCRLLV